MKKSFHTFYFIKFQQIFYKIINTFSNSSFNNSDSGTKNEIVDSRDKEIVQLKKEIRNKTETYTQEIANLQIKLSEQAKQIRQLQEENSKLKSNRSSSSPKLVKLEILDSEFIQNLERVCDIGSSGNGRVMKVFKKVAYALKIMNVRNPDIKSVQRFIGEYEILNLLNHPFIIQVFGIFMSDEKNPPAILLEFCPLDLVKAIKEETLSNVQIVLYIFQIVEGMKYVHFKKIIHRDLKPSNILIGDDGKIRISDFGISKLMCGDDSSMTSLIGTQKFMAPELINEEDYNEKIDVYSFGVLVFYILSNGKLPKITVTQIGMGKKAEIPSSFTKFSKSLINKCWNFDPDDRPSFKEICDEMEANKFNLVNLTKSETKEVMLQIKEYKALIPFYES